MAGATADWRTETQPVEGVVLVFRETALGVQNMGQIPVAVVAGHQRPGRVLVAVRHDDVGSPGRPGVVDAADLAGVPVVEGLEAIRPGHGAKLPGGVMCVGDDRRGDGVPRLGEQATSGVVGVVDGLPLGIGARQQFTAASENSAVSLFADGSVRPVGTPEPVIVELP